VLNGIHELADGTHSKAIADLVAAGNHREELLITLGKVGLPRYANFIGRYKDDPAPGVRRSVAAALGLIDNEAVATPVLVQLLARGTGPEDFMVRWEASESLVKVAKRKGGEGVRRRVLELLREPDAMTATLAARSLAHVGEPRGLEKLRETASHPDPRVRAEALLALGEAADRAGREVVVRRLKDDNLAVRACAVFALGRIAGATAAPELRAAVQEALAYEQELERRRARGESEQVLRERYGLGVYDLRETLQEALGP
jgi:HEAT repeat protein